MKDAANRKAQKQRIMEIIAKKENSATNTIRIMERDRKKIAKGSEV